MMIENSVWTLGIDFINVWLNPHCLFMVPKGCSTIAWRRL